MFVGAAVSHYASQLQLRVLVLRVLQLVAWRLRTLCGLSVAGHGEPPGSRFLTFGTLPATLIFHFASSVNGVHGAAAKDPLTEASLPEAFFNIANMGSRPCRVLRLLACPAPCCVLRLPHCLGEVRAGQVPPTTTD